MTKYLIPAAIVLLLCSCESNTYEDLQDNMPVDGAITYNEHIKQIIEDNCLSCHSEGGASSFRPLGTYSQLKDAVLTTNLLERIQMQNGEAGQMPADGRMPSASINMILEWNEDGLPEN